MAQPMSHPACLCPLWGLGLLFVCNTVLAEPYLAVRNGLKCMACHVNPSGGGKRTALGRSYEQTILPAVPAEEPLGENISRYMDIGADIRTSAIAAQTRDSDDEFAFNTDRANIYLQTRLVSDQLTLYLDQQFAPASYSREAWLLLQNKRGTTWLNAGRLFLPYGLRLEDDTAFFRAIPGINFSTPDNGVETRDYGWHLEVNPERYDRVCVRLISSREIDRHDERHAQSGSSQIFSRECPVFCEYTFRSIWSAT